MCDFKCISKFNHNIAQFEGGYGCKGLAQLLLYGAYSLRLLFL